MSKHTPGPWEVEERRPDKWWVVADDGIDICEVDYGYDENSELYPDIIPNAHLIAAAPETYKELKAVEWVPAWDNTTKMYYLECPCCGAEKPHHDDFCSLDNALKKAQGKDNE